MSTQAKPEFVEEELSEQAVHDFLAAHPDFFERHSTLLGSLILPHASGAAVSLVERQVSVLRQKELKLKRQLKELIEVARENDVLAAEIHELTLQLMSADDLGEGRPGGSRVVWPGKRVRGYQGRPFLPRYRSQ